MSAATLQSRCGAAGGANAPDFLELNSLSAIAKHIEPEYQATATKKLTNRLKSVHLLGCPQEIASCNGAGVLIGTPGKSRNYKDLQAATQRYSATLRSN